MESYITLIEKELSYPSTIMIATPKQQYEYLMELKRFASERHRMLGTLSVCANTFKALSETRGLENVKSICESGFEMASQYDSKSAVGDLV